MAINRNGQATKYKFLHNGRMLKKGFHNSTTLIWSAGSTVTYKVDTGVEYTEEVDSGATCFAPKTFTPKKDGWTFVGWREDSTASGDVLTNKVMDSEPITLYAVFKQTVTTNWISGEAGATKKTVTGTNYYNNGNIGYATLDVPAHADYSGWTWRGWSYNGKTEANASVDPDKNAATITYVDGTRTYYGLYQKDITVGYYQVSNVNKNVDRKQAYYNSAKNTSYPKFTINTNGFGSEWTWRGWMTEANPHAGIVYENINGTEITDNVTLYPSIYMVICLSFDGNGATGGSVNSQWTWSMLTTSGGGNIHAPASFVLPDNGFAKTNHSFTGWNKGAVGATIEVWENTTVYAQWQLVPLTLFDNGALRSGDSFHPYSTWDNADNDDTALREASCGNTLYAYGRTSNYDRYSIAGGIFAQAIDLSGFTKLRVTLNSASIVSSNNSRWFAGLRNNWFSGGNNAGIPYLDNCVLLSEATGGTFDLDLTAYRNAYGNGAYFLFGAGKVNRNSPNGGAWVHIAKVWLE